MHHVRTLLAIALLCAVTIAAAGVTQRSPSPALGAPRQADAFHAPSGP